MWAQEPEQGSPDWAAYHEELRLRKHEQNKRRRQIEKAAIGATIAAAKVRVSSPPLISSHVRVPTAAMPSHSVGQVRVSVSVRCGGVWRLLEAAVAGAGPQKRPSSCTVYAVCIPKSPHAHTEA